MELLREAGSLKDIGLVEFPGVLVPAFEPTLIALQNMLKTKDMPFVDAITTGKGNSSTDGISRYARALDFQLDLGVLSSSKSSLPFSPHKPFIASELVADTTLDEGRAQALLYCLSSSPSLIQDPPGTGKFYRCGSD